MNNGIQIIVMGEVGSGKTILAQEIVETLRSKGLDVKWDISQDYKSEEDATRTGVERLNCLERVAAKTSIVVKEVQAKKDFNASLNYRVQEYTKDK